MCQPHCTCESRFFEGKATEHLIGAGVQPEHLNDDRLGRVLDELFLAGLTRCLINIAMKAVAKFGVTIETAHLDSTSFHLHGEYETGKDIFPHPEAPMPMNK